jgi:hypothetical protein
VRRRPLPAPATTAVIVGSCKYMRTRGFFSTAFAPSVDCPARSRAPTFSRATRGARARGVKILPRAHEMHMWRPAADDASMSSSRLSALRRHRAVPDSMRSQPRRWLPSPVLNSASSAASSMAAAAALPRVAVGCVGLGAMGEGMAACLLRDGFEVTVLGNTSRGPVDRLVAAGATEAFDARELAQKVDVVCLCLPNSVVVEAVLEDMKPALSPGKTILDTGTSSLASTARLADVLASLGVGFAEAPLAGGKAQAAEGVLGALVGTSDDTVFATVEPVLGSFCSSVQVTLRALPPPCIDL